MFKSLKYLFYALLIIAGLFLYWFLPKYSFIHKNPGYCTNLTNHIYYCGNLAGLDRIMNMGR